MLFTTYSPYIEKGEVIYYNGKINAEEPETIKCFICFQTQTECQGKIYQMKLCYKYYKKCQCDAFAHTNCLDEWITLTRSCPICRKPLLSCRNYYFAFITNVAKSNINVCSILLFFTKISIHFVAIIIVIIYAVYFLTSLLLHAIKT